MPTDPAGSTLEDQLKAAADIVSYHAGSRFAMTAYYDYRAVAEGLKQRARVVRAMTAPEPLLPGEWFDGYRSALNALTGPLAAVPVTAPLAEAGRCAEPGCRGRNCIEGDCDECRAVPDADWLAWKRDAAKPSLSDPEGPT